MRLLTPLLIGRYRIAYGNKGLRYQYIIPTVPHPTSYSASGDELHIQENLLYDWMFQCKSVEECNEEFHSWYFGNPRGSGFMDFVEKRLS